VARPVEVTKTAGPLGAGRYNSPEELKADLLAMGPHKETYDTIFGIVGADNDDSAKEALSQFFQGSTGALSSLYDLMVAKGMANPMDAGIVENVMQTHPEVNDHNNHGSTGNHNHGQHEMTPQASIRQDGLYIPASTASVGTKLEKLAGGGIGGAGSGYPAYVMSGPGDNRMCPKIRNVVNTFTCRFHCIDGLAIDDHQVLCGEAIWRQAVMDKFSSEYKDASGEWVGGYLNKRFQIERNDGGHPYQLKPGQRHAPIHEDAWSTEKRLQELRKSESKDRKYAETPGDGPKDLYNFDQHDIAKGPKSPTLFEKPKDPIAKIAGKCFNLKTAMWSEGPANKVQSGTECPACGMIGKATDALCPNCKTKMQVLPTQTQRDRTGTISPSSPMGNQPRMNSSNIEVRVANGVYRATKNGVSAYGDTPREAAEKFGPLNDQLMSLMQGEEDQREQQENQPAPLAASPVPGMNMPGSTPSTPNQEPLDPTRPTDVIQGGTSHFDDARMPKGPAHIDPKHLDNHIDQHLASTPPEEVQMDNNMAQNIVLGPDRKTHAQ